MPNDLVLPGITDTGTAAPAQGGNTPAQDDNSGQPATPDATSRAAEPSATDPAAPVDENDPNAQQRPDRSRRTRDNRIDQLTTEKRTAERNFERVQAQNDLLIKAVLEGRIAPQQAAERAGVAGDLGAPPDESKYTDWREFNRDTAKYWAKVGTQEMLQRAAQQQRQQLEQRNTQATAQQREQATEQLHTILGTQMHGVAARYPDYVEVIAEASEILGDMPVNVEAAMAITGFGGDIAYYLAKHPHVVPQLARLPDVALGNQMAIIANYMRTSAAAISNAPAPGRPGGSRGSAPADYPANATPEQHQAWKKAHEPRKEKR